MADHKENIHHLEQDNEVYHSHPHRTHDEMAAHGFAVDSEEMRKGYFSSPTFIGTFTAVGMNLMASTGGFALVAPVLNQINASVGPSVNIIWLSLVYTIGLAIGLLLVGRLSDIFGRRWFFIGGTLMGVVGAIIAATAQTLPTLIGGQTLVGLSACTGYSYAFVSGEIVPVKYRFVANAIIFVFSLPTAGFGATISTAFILYTKAGWRWVYYFLIILNAVACSLYAIFYHPPTLAEKRGKGHTLQLIKNFDFVGMILFTGGLVLFILGLASGGDGLYPWTDPHVIAFIVIGAVLLIALFCWESFANLKEPLIPMHLFRNRGFVASTISLAVGASTYYSQAIIFPALISNVYANGRLMWAGWAACVVGVSVTVGEMAGGTLAHPLGKTKFQVIAAMCLATLFLGLMGLADINSVGLALGLVFIGTFFVGYNESIVLPICSIVIPDQDEIGTAVGVTGSVRSAVSTVASAIYSVVLANRLASTISGGVPAALVQAGLPASSVVEYMTAATAGSATLLEQVPGFSTSIQAAGALAYRVAYMDAYRTIFYVSIAFGATGILVNFMVPNVDEMMTSSIAATLHEKREKPVVERKELEDGREIPT